MYVSQTPLSPQGEPFGKYIARLRETKGITKTELARRDQVHLTTILRLEGGKVKGQKLKHQVLRRIATVLEIPVEFLRSAAQGLAMEQNRSRICPSCWVPATPPDTRWGFADARFCLRCGEGLVTTCSCGEPILLQGRFCPQCGKQYSL